MKSEFFTSGCVEKSFSSGRTGFIRDVFGKLYYFTESSFSGGIMGLKEGSTVIFKPDIIRNDRTNSSRLFAADVSFD